MHVELLPPQELASNKNSRALEPDFALDIFVAVVFRFSFS